jgi:hypothetical protein
MEQEEIPIQKIPTRGEIRRKKGRNYLLISISSLVVYVIWDFVLEWGGAIGALLLVSIIVFLLLGVSTLMKARTGN